MAKMQDLVNLTLARVARESPHLQVIFK